MVLPSKTTNAAKSKKTLKIVGGILTAGLVVGAGVVFMQQPDNTSATAEQTINSGDCAKGCDLFIPFDNSGNSQKDISAATVSVSFFDKNNKPVDVPVNISFGYNTGQNKKGIAWDNTKLVNGKNWLKIEVSPYDQALTMNITINNAQVSPGSTSLFPKTDHDNINGLSAEEIGFTGAVFT